MKKILVIKLGAVGDFIQATGIFADIRAHEKDAHITLLTSPKMRSLAEASPYYNEVVYIHRHSSWLKWHTWYEARQKLKGHDFIYDLQNSDRTRVYFFLTGRTPWCGNHILARYRSKNQRALKSTHSFRRLQDLVETAGVPTGHWPNLDYAREDASPDLNSLSLKKYMVLVPGSSTAHAYKRWPHYADLTKKLQQMGHNCLFLGGPDEVDLLSNLSAQTGAPALYKNPLSQVVDILARSDFVVGNDTGMLHMAAAVGVPCVTLFGGIGSPPGKSAPTGKNSKVIYNSHIGAITCNEVLKTLGLNG